MTDDVLTCAGTATAVADGPATVEPTCTRQTGGVAIAGDAVLAV